MDIFANIIVFYGFVAVITWLVVIQLDLNKIKNKLKDINYKNTSNFILNQEESKPQEPVQEVQDNSITPSLEEKIEEKLNETEEEAVKKKSTFEEKFFGNIFNKIGAVAILIALCILVKIVSPYIVFTNEMKIALGFLTGLGMIFGAFKVQKDEKMKKFSEVLMGTGFGSLLITIYFGAGILKVFNTPVATTLAVLTTLAIYFVADKQKTISAIVIGLIGGYLNPYFVNYHITMDFLFWYLIFLNVLSIVFVYRNRSKDTVNIINLIMSAICIAGLSLISGNEVTICQLITLWGLYIVYDILCINKDGFTKEKPLRYTNFTILTLLSLLIYKNYNEIGTFLYGVSIVYAMLGIGYLYKTQEKENGYFHSCIIAVFMTIFFFTKDDDLMRISLWSLEALIVGVFACKYKLKTLSNYLSLIFTAILFKLFISPDVYDTLYEYPVLNDRILYFLAPVASGSLIGCAAKKYGEIRKYEIFKFLSISLIYVYTILEINSAFIDSQYHKNFVAYIVPTILFLYSLNFNLLSKNVQNKTLYEVAKNFIFWLGLIWLLMSDMNSVISKDMLPIINIRTIAYSMLGLTMFFEIKRNESEWKKYLAVIIGFLYIHYESINIFNYFTNIEWIISVSWVIYAGLISIIGIFKNKKVLKVSGIWLSILTIIRIFLYDLANLNLIYKLIAFITLGVVLLIISYIYNKRKPN